MELKVQYSWTLVLILSQVNSIHTFSALFYQINCNIFLSYMPGSSM
jgi:hypothetical protein